MYDLIVFIIICISLFLIWTRNRSAMFTIVTICFLLFIFQIFLRFSNHIEYSYWMFSLGFYSLSNPLSLLTSMFIHAGALHILSNLVILVLVGMQFEDRVGSRKFLILYICSGIVSIFSFYIFHFGAGMGLLVGASGAIFGILGAFLILYPEDEIPMFLGFIFFSRIKVKYVVLVLFIYESILTFFVINDNIAHIAHVGGAITGMFLAKYIPSFDPYTKINYEFLESEASSNILKELLKKIKEEDDMNIQVVLIDSFLNKLYGKEWKRYKKKAFRKF